jgi:aryl-alcohol dehydrogenase-like predicted oxidoreductase
MKYRTLGRTGYQVSEIGFGAWGIGGDWWKGSDDEESLASVKLALDYGVNFIDTAHNYGNGHSETLVGRAVREAGERVYVASKIPPKNYTWPASEGTPMEDVYPAEWIIECTETSLKRLGLEQIDLHQFHVWRDEWAELDEWKEVVQKLKQSGKVGAFGISLNYPLEGVYAESAVRSGMIDVLQMTYNIFEQEAQTAIFPMAEELNIGIIAKSPLDEGALTGKITPETEFEAGGFLDTYFKDDRKQEVWDRVQALGFLLKDEKATLADAALRFCLSKPVVSSLIVGMRNPKHVEANVRASDRGPLPKEDLSELEDHAWPHNFWI